MKQDLSIHANFGIVIRTSLEDFNDVLEFLKQKKNLEIIYIRKSIGKVWIMTDADEVRSADIK